MYNKLNINEIYNILKEFFDYKAEMMSINRNEAGGAGADREITCKLYDAFLFRCGLYDEHQIFGGCIVIGSENDIVSRKFLGRKLSMNADKESIIESLKIVDDYCRLRLPDKYLEAYDKAYKK